MVDDISIVTGKTKKFGTVDYVLFSAILIVSAAIGFYFAWVDRRKTTIKDYMLAGGNMQTGPVALSLLASFMSAITLLGTPVEMYQYSTMYIYIGVAYFLVMAAAAHIYIPIFFRLQITSTFEYLQMRFGRVIRTAGSVIYIFQMMLYMSIVLFAPALALNAVTGFSLWGAIISVGSVCTVYTAFCHEVTQMPFGTVFGIIYSGIGLCLQAMLQVFKEIENWLFTPNEDSGYFGETCSNLSKMHSLGGMKAVLWTDCFQVGMMLASYGAIFIQGSIEAGSFSAAWDIMDKSGRVIFDDFSPDPSVRHSFWSLVFGGYITWVAVYGVNQAMVQRACSLPTLKRAQWAFWLNAPGLCVILILGCLNGIVVYAFYSKCDPKGAGIIKKNDQLLPLFVMDVLGKVRGLPGLFVAGLFSGALSTISSGLNAVAAVMLQDIIRAFFVKNMTELRATRVSQLLALIFGCICLALTYVAAQLGDVLQAALSLYGMLSGPMLGLFTLGMIFPQANEKGALVALVTSLMFTFSMGIGNFVHKPSPNPAPSPVSTAGCGFNITIKTVAKKAPVDVSPLFSVSYLWYGAYAVTWIIIVGLIVSYITGPPKPEELDPKLISPLFDILPPFRFLPERWRKPLRFGVIHEGKYDVKMSDSAREAELEALGRLLWKDICDMSFTISTPSGTALPTPSKHSEQASSATGSSSQGFPPAQVQNGEDMSSTV